MTEFEAAFFYGDFSSLRELARAILSENVEDTDTQEEILT